jgi:hypothetical protein
MADARPETFRFGNITGTFYSFDKEGDEVPYHYHGKNLGHICVVLAGQVRCESVNHPTCNWDKVVNEGEVLDMPDEEWHKITALKPNTKIMNINRYTTWTPNDIVLGH